MPIHYKDIKTPRQWRAATGVTEAQFLHLATLYGQAYEEIFSRTLAERQGDSRQAPAFTTYEELVFFGLFSIKTGLTYDVIALAFGISISSAHRIQEMFAAVIRAALVRGGHAPKREYADAAQFVRDWQGEGAILVDATEHRRQRPKEQAAQEATYSGKKKGHTVKAMVMTTAGKRIKYVSAAVRGSVHDFALLKANFPTEVGSWFGRVTYRDVDGTRRKAVVHVDLGYQGIEAAYPRAKVSIPEKKPRGKPRSQEARTANREKSKARVSVENAIGGLKRYRFLSDRLRCRRLGFYDTILEVAAGLWNFNLTYSKI